MALVKAVITAVSATKRKILITGATGFVGQAVCQGLIDRGFDVQILLRDPSGLGKIPLKLGASIVLGSLDNESALAVACDGCNQILHLAGMAHAGKGKAKQAVATNLNGTQNLVAAAIKAKVGRLVFLSSSLAEAAASGSGDVTAYGESKLAAEQLLQQAAKQQQIEVVVVRSVNVYGPSMKGNIARMIAMIDKGQMPPLPEINNQISLVSAVDLAQALLLALDAKAPGDLVITVTDGQQYSINEIESAIYRNLGRPMPRWRTPAMLLFCAAMMAGLVSRITGGSISGRTYRNLTSDNLFSNGEARSGLGFEPSTTFYDSLPKIVEAIRAKDD
ncbi:MAG: UDP-glucose 4-epimerase [Glaciecola sp.]